MRRKVSSKSTPFFCSKYFTTNVNFCFIGLPSFFNQNTNLFFKYLLPFDNSTKCYVHSYANNQILCKAFLHALLLLDNYLVILIDFHTHYLKTYTYVCACVYILRDWNYIAPKIKRRCKVDILRDFHHALLLLDNYLVILIDFHTHYLKTYTCMRVCIYWEIGTTSPLR